MSNLIIRSFIAMEIVNENLNFQLSLFVFDIPFQLPSL